MDRFAPQFFATVAMVFMVIIGGIGTIEGPIIGAIVYVVLQQVLYDYPVLV